MTPAHRNDEAAAVNRVVARLTSANLPGVMVRRLGRIPALFHPSAGPDTPFALFSCGEIFFKTGPDTVTKYIARGMRPFRSEPRQALRGYFSVPPEVVADADLLDAWALAAVAAAAQFGRRRPRPLRRRRRSSAGSRAISAPDRDDHSARGGQKNALAKPDPETTLLAHPPPPGRT